MKQFLRYTALLSFFLLLLPTASALGAARIAQLPPVVEGSAADVDAETVDALEEMVAHDLHMPLNDTMGWLTYVDERALMDAYDSACGQYATRRGYDYPAVLRATADAVEADLVVLPILTTYYEEIYYTSIFYEENFLHSGAAVRLLVYDRATGEIIDRRDARSYADEDQPSGRAYVLAGEVMRNVLAAANLRAHLRDLRETARGVSYHKKGLLHETNVQQPQFCAKTPASGVKYEYATNFT